jgi:predicted Fe-Mo cluster-binding NifX family protein
MELCVSSTGKDIGSRVDTAFGRAPFFLIIDTETMAVEVVENPAATAGHGAGIAAAQTVADKGVDGVLSGYVGPNAFNALRAASIRIFEGASENDTVEEAVTKFKRSEFKETTTPPEGPGCEPGRGQGRGRGGMGRGRGGCRRQ